MRIELFLNGNPYAIEVENNQYIAIKYGINNKEGDNFGKQTTKELGYFTKLSYCCLKLCREEISSSPDIVTLNEFALRLEAINKQLLKQLEAVPV